MIQDEVFIQLSAYADGELPDADRATLEARLAQDPALAKVLSAFKQLAIAAKAEAVPDIFSRESRSNSKTWALVSEHALSIPPLISEKLNALAQAEACPVMSEEFARRTWWAIAGRTVHSFKDNALFATPKVSDENWSKAWKHITTRARIAVAEPKKNEINPVVPKVVPISAAPAAMKARRSSIWGWALATAVAAAAMLALVLSSPENPGNPEPSNSNSMAMSIPESQDDRYGVLVKYVPGSDDPVICLYEKNLDSGGK